MLRRGCSERRVIRTIDASLMILTPLLSVVTSVGGGSFGPERPRISFKPGSGCVSGVFILCGLLDNQEGKVALVFSTWQDLDVCKLREACRKPCRRSWAPLRMFCQRTGAQVGCEVLRAGITQRTGSGPLLCLRDTDNLLRLQHSSVFTCSQDQARKTPRVADRSGQMASWRGLREPGRQTQVPYVSCLPCAHSVVDIPKG